MLEALKVFWEIAVVLFDAIVGICSNLYDVFGVWFIAASVIVVFICIASVFGGLIDDYPEYRKQHNYKNLEKISKKIDKL